LQVTGGHARWSIHSDWIDDSLLLGLQRGEPALFVSVEDARTRDIADGDFVEVYNDVGNFRVQVAVSPAVRPGQVMIYHAWENFQFQGWRHFKRVMPSPLNPIELVGDYGHIRPDVLSLTPGPNDRGTRVEVRKALS
ncbi:MAG: nitrate reductase, partial [Chloroflexi bacterium]|nr:nitrate reductase [Chloroflexota bacterium]